MEHCILQEKKRINILWLISVAHFKSLLYFWQPILTILLLMINFLLKIFLTRNTSLFRWMVMPYLCLGELAEHVSFPNIIQSSFLQFLYLQLICEDQFVYSAQVKM